MYEYNQGTLYTGNIVKEENDKQIIIKENAMLIYDGQKDSFYTVEVLNYLLDLETNKNLSASEREEYQRIVNKNSYPHCNKRNDNISYIDKKTIIPFSSKEKNPKKR